MSTHATTPPELRAQLDALTGQKLGPYMSFNPVSRVQIWQWCSAMGDRNPLYLDDEYLRLTEFPRPVAPPAMMQMWTMRDFNDNYAPGSTEAKPYRVFDELAALGYSSNVAVSYDIRFLRYLHEGEHPKHYTTVINISDKKSTSLGVGFFVTEQVDYTTETNWAFATAVITYFQYRARPSDIETASVREKKPTAVIESYSDWRPDYQNIDLTTLKPGHKLPELAIPITHRLIVGGAIATQDFIPVHHSVPAAQAAGMPDIFMNILTSSGLCAHYLTGWAGANSRLKALKFSLMAPNLPGDTMVLQGKVKQLETGDNRSNISVDFAGKNQSGFHLTGSAKMALTNCPLASNISI